MASPAPQEQVRPHLVSYLVSYTQPPSGMNGPMNECSMDHSFPGTNVPRNEWSREQKFHHGNECFRERIVLRTNVPDTVVGWSIRIRTLLLQSGVSCGGKLGPGPLTYIHSSKQTITAFPVITCTVSDAKL